MAKRNVKIPKWSWLDQKGQRWMKVTFDVMIGGGKFLRQITITFPLNLDLSLRNYVVDFGDVSDFRSKVNQQYPTLQHIRNITFLPAGNKVLR